MSSEHKHEKVIACHILLKILSIIRSSPPEVFLGKDVLKICSKFTREHPCRSVIAKNCFATLSKSYFDMSVLLLHIFRTTFPKSTSGKLLLKYAIFRTKGVTLKRRWACLNKFQLQPLALPSR